MKTVTVVSYDSAKSEVFDNVTATAVVGDEMPILHIWHDGVDTCFVLNNVFYWEVAEQGDT